MLVYGLVLVSFIWLLAVFKVFILDDGIARRPSPSFNQLKPSKYIVPAIPRQRASTTDASPPHRTNALPSASSNNRVVNFVRHEPSSGRKPSAANSAKRLPNSADWLAMYTESKSFSLHPAGLAPPATSADSAGANLPPPPAVQDRAISSSSALSWPPVLADGSIPPNEGFDLMTMTGLKVPRFWSPPKDADLFKTGSLVQGQETIFLMIASYRDFQCRETITSAFQRADHPERLFVAAVDQVVPGDIGCLDLDIPCTQDPTQPICRYRQQISVYTMDATRATGPVTARHIGDRMYRGEFFVMQLDAHCQFVRHWDSQIITQWKSTHNEMAVLSSYLTDVQGSFTPDGDSTRKTRPIMCNSDFEGLMPARYLRHGSQPEDYPSVRDMPQLQPFWAAGFSFSRGHFKVQVPYDGYQPMVFQGEEIAIGIRGFTYGYDFYAPRDSVVFHEYADHSARRKKIHMFWENTGHAGEGQRSLRRATSVIGMAPDVDPSTWDHSEIERYGLGKGKGMNERGWI